MTTELRMPPQVVAAHLHFLSFVHLDRLPTPSEVKAMRNKMNRLDSADSSLGRAQAAFEAWCNSVERVLARMARYSADERYAIRSIVLRLAAVFAGRPWEPGPGHAPSGNEALRRLVAQTERLGEVMLTLARDDLATIHRLVQALADALRATAATQEATATEVRPT